MITWYSHTAEKQWHDGAFKVEVLAWNRRTPLAYCDGTADDEARIRAIGEEEGVDELRIEKQPIKWGRERWTVVGADDDTPDEDG